MKALHFTQTGDLAHLQMAEIAVPVPRAGEVLVRIEAAGINPSDVKNVRGFFAYTKPPRVPGRDFAGTVVEGPSHLIGQRVFGSGKELGFFGDGSHAQFITVAETGVTPMPAALSLEQAASVGVPYVTAWEALERAGAGAGVRLVIVGVGAVGRAARDLARWRGAEVVLAVRRAAQAEALMAAGWRVVTLTEAALSEQLPPHFGGTAEVIFDTTGLWLDRAVTALAPAGRLALIAAPPGGKVGQFPALDLYRRGATLIGVNSLLHGATASAAMLAPIARGWQSGALALPPAPRPWPFADALAAYRTVDAGCPEKIVLTGFA